MKVLVAVDMEGIAGVVTSSQTSPGDPDYAHARAWMIGEANAAVRGAFAAGANEVVVSDSHGGNGCRNMLPHELDERATLMTGSPKTLDGEQGLGADCDALILLGMHTRNGTRGVVSHTIHGLVVDEVRINGVPFGEVGLLAALAGHYGVPTVLVAGDDLTAREAEGLMPWVNTVTVKWALSRNAARTLPPAVAARRIEEATEKALVGIDAARCLGVSTPVTMEMDFMNSGAADGAAAIPGVERISGSGISYVAEDFAEASRMMSACIGGAWSVTRAWLGR